MTRWIDLATAAKILGVSEEEAVGLLLKAKVPINRCYPTGYNAQAVEELARIRKAGK